MSLSLNLARSFLMKFEPEKAHELTLLSLEQGFHPRYPLPDDRRLHQTIWGLDFPNPFGVAAGFDKDARVPHALLSIGFGFAEVGTVTPQPQTGNPPPRVFRLVEDRAVINRLGFNSIGHAAVLERLTERKGEGTIGVNLGANADSEDKLADYVAGIEAFSAVADYLVINISSPNTPGLRDLQGPDALEELLFRIGTARRDLAAAGVPRPPMLVKLSPDIDDDELPQVINSLLAHNVDGIIVSNTTLSRDGLHDRAGGREAGGLSGPPLFARSTRMLARVYLLTEGRVPLIGVGGVDSGEAAVEKMRAGASLVQLYTGLVYEGPELLEQLKDDLGAALEAGGIVSVDQLVGTSAVQWAERDPADRSFR